MKKKVLNIVQEYVLSHIDNTTPISEFEIFEVSNKSPIFNVSSDKDI